MIRYHISAVDLQGRIDAENPTWRTRAAARTAEFVAAAKYSEKSHMWSEVKAVYIRLQHHKCGFCERLLESEEFGLAEHDIEHFRPKGRVTPWPLPTSVAAMGLIQTPVGPGGSGYYALPYHEFNYIVACKPCNSALKKEYFPICGAYNFSGTNPALMAAEQVLLIYPIGYFDVDPETLIKFVGLIPQPVVVAAGYQRFRALTTIDIFGLGNPARKNIFRERAFVIVAMFPQLQRLHGVVPASAVEINSAQMIVDAGVSEKNAHASCARSFRELFQANQADAEKIYHDACAYLGSIS